MLDSKRAALMKKIEAHLRKTARQLIKINTVDEALQYLTDSFRLELYCDFVGVILKEGEQFVAKTWSGHLPVVVDAFPLSAADCSSKLMHFSLTDETGESPQKCRFSEILKKAHVKTWFTVPIKTDQERYGFCVLGFFNYIPLLDMEKSFEEFGQDIALAISLMGQKEVQLKKEEGMEWFSKHFSLDTPLEQHLHELTSRAGAGTNADFACIYFYHESENCLELQQPYVGELTGEDKIVIHENYLLKHHFPYLETAGGQQLTVPIVVHLKLMGVLHVEKKRDAVFTDEDLRMLQLLSNHFSTLLENARLFNNEKNHKKRLHSLLTYQQELVKETVKDNNFDGITSMLGSLFERSIVLFDRFLRPIAYDLGEMDPSLLTMLAESAHEEEVTEKQHSIITMQVADHFVYTFSFWTITGGKSLLGYLAVGMSGETIDEFEQLTIDLARNICSIQFIKQKLVFDATEQAKDSFLGKLLIEKMNDANSILQYANLFQWDLFRSHRVAVLSIELDQGEMKANNVLEQQAAKTTLWDRIKALLSDMDSGMMTASHDDKFILIVPVELEGRQPKKYWQSLYERMQSAAAKKSICRIFVGIGGKTKNIQDYYTSYQQSLQALNVVNSRLRDTGFSMFEELGSYTILYHLEHIQAVPLFVSKYLEPLLRYSEEKSIDLCETLYVFLQNNGNVKTTAEELYIHRSSLAYRLGKIESLLEEDLNDAEVRFNLMMAFKLFDLYGAGQKNTRLLV